MIDPDPPWHVARLSARKSDLMSMKEIAAKAGVTYQYVRELRAGTEKSKPPFPKAFTKLGVSPLWHRHEINQWIFQRDRFRETGQKLWK